MSAFSDFWDRITGRDTLLAIMKSQSDELKANATELQNDAALIEQFKKAVLDMKGQIPVIDPLETYWNTKRPATNGYTYPARTILDGSVNISMDPRLFWERWDSSIPSFSGEANDAKAMTCLRWVINNIAYTPDVTQFKHIEEWLHAHETFFLRKGDCEDGAILMGNIMLKSGIPYWRIRLNAGDVKGGGHCWVTYLRESDNVWYILDWCYYPNDSLRWLPWKAAENYFNIWFSFNRDFIFAQDALDKP